MVRLLCVGMKLLQLHQSHQSDHTATTNRTLVLFCIPMIDLIALIAVVATASRPKLTPSPTGVRRHGQAPPNTSIYNRNSASFTLPPHFLPPSTVGLVLTAHRTSALHFRVAPSLPSAGDDAGGREGREQVDLQRGQQVIAHVISVADNAVANESSVD